MTKMESVKSECDKDIFVTVTNCCVPRVCLSIDP